MNEKVKTVYLWKSNSKYIDTEFKSCSELHTSNHTKRLEVLAGSLAHILTLIPGFALDEFCGILATEIRTLDHEVSTWELSHAMKRAIIEMNNKHELEV